MLTANIVGERARLTPEKTALVSVSTGARYTYSDLDERAGRCAAALNALGVGKGDRVALLAHNRVEFLDVFLAAARSGIIAVPLGTRLTARELAFIVNDAGAKACVYDGAFAASVAELRPQVTVPSWIALDAPVEPGDFPYRAMVDRAAAAHPERCEPEDLCCLLYTSGTTGKPKGVMIPHRMIGWNAYNTAIGWQLREDDISPIFTPLYHAGGLGAYLMPIFAIGGTIVLHARFDPVEVWRTIERERCTVVLGVPTIYKLLMETPEFSTADLSSLRYFHSGGAPLPLYSIEAYQRRGVAFKQGYGLTEVGVNCFAMTIEESVRKAGSIGKPLMFTEARVVADAGREAATDEVGELWLRGAHVCSGYWNNAEATATSLDSDGWFHTGDLARRDAEGFFYIAGRQKDMLISGGVNVYPAEIEAELLLHPGVQDAAVVGVPDETWGEVGVAFIVPRQSGTISGDELAAFLTGRLARYKIPHRFVFIDAMPRTAYGKIVKGELRERWLTAGRRHE